MSSKIQYNYFTNTLNWPLILIAFGLFTAFISLASSEQQRLSYLQRTNYNSERQSPENPYQNRNQPGRVYNNGQRLYPISGQQQPPQRELGMRDAARRPPQNPVADRNEHKRRIWIPAEVFDRYPWATKISEDPYGMLQIEICDEGYGPQRSRGFTFCRPLCDNCPNGICTAPGVCECYEEYTKNDNDDCVFTCPLGCLNGQCYLDGTCQCDPGYKLDESRKFCRPICSSGCGTNEAHNCTEPEVCGCAKGYRLTDDGCQPVCEPDCGSNGRCVGPNACECHGGTSLRDDVCQDECYQKCSQNGICYARNRCICKPGFTYHERSTMCVPV